MSDDRREPTPPPRLVPDTAIPEPGADDTRDTIAVGGLFGQLAVAMGFCGPEALRLAVGAVRDRREDPGAPRLGEILIEMKALTAPQVREILEAQRKALLECPRCRRRYNARTVTGQAEPKCPECGVRLVLPKDPSSVRADASVGGVTIETADGGAARAQSYASLPGTVLGHYQIEQLLGEGGMGAVFLAQHKLLKRACALKVLPADLTLERERVRRFLREAEAMAQLRHPNIVGIHHVGAAQGVYFIEMELVPGGTLGRKLKLESPLPVPVAVPLMRAIAEGLAAAHARGIVHRDMKPDNVLLDRDGTPKIGDFGLAKALEGTAATAQVTGEARVMGTPHYMSPEQARGDAADARSDVYALGVCYFEILTGTRPFEDDRAMAVLMRHMHEEAPSPRKRRPDLPRSLANVVERMLAKNPAERYQHAGEVATALDAVARGEEIAYTARRVRQRRARLLGSALLLVALGAGGGAVWARVVATAARGSGDGGAAARGQAIATAARDATAAYRAGDDATARRELGKLRMLAPTHAALALAAHLDARERAAVAWRNGDPAGVSALVAPLCAADAEDRPAATLRARADTLARARAALAARDTDGAGAAAGALLGLEADHAEARAIATAADRLARAAAAAAAGDHATAATRAAEALAARREDGWARELLATSGRALAATVRDALARKDLPAAEAAARALAAADPAAAEAPAAAVRRARDEYDKGLSAGREFLARGDGAGARVALDRAITVFASDEATSLHREARVRELRAAATAADAAQDPDGALRHATAAQALAPEDPDLALELARLGGRAADARCGRARAAVRAGDLEGAARLVVDALALLAEHGEARLLQTEIAARRALPDGFVFLPAGAYPVGASDEPGHPPRRVRLAAVYLARHEVTNRDYARFVATNGYGDPRFFAPDARDALPAFRDATGRPGPAGWRNGAPRPGTEDEPVTGVAWHEALAYARSVGARLPTEDEWEVAASYDPATDTGHRFPWGDAWEPGRVGLATGVEPALAPVGRRLGDLSAMGCHDMAGNAMEWTASAWGEGAHRVVRGGAIHPTAVAGLRPEEGCRLARRRTRADPLAARLPVVGFRLARDPAVPGGGGR